MKAIYIIISIIFFLYGCVQKKKERIISDYKAVIMPVSILSDTTVYELIIVPDTFSVLSNAIPIVLINHSDEDAYYGSGDIAREYYNDSIGRWENAKTPPRFVPVHMLWKLPAKSKVKAKFSIFDNRPGKYRISYTFTKPRCLKAESEYYLSTTSDSIVLNDDSQDSGKENFDSQKDITTREENEQENIMIEFANKRAWENAYKVRAFITDSDFLMTKRPMSDDAIAPINYHTGLVEDRAYNQVIYTLALERAKKHLTLRNDKLVLKIESGSEINIAEDLFQFIVMLVDSWDELIKEGLLRIVKTKDGNYDVEPVPKTEIVPLED
ncbi:hypothetical protein M1P97_09440 [Parabacteroides sp. GYB001]|uniref:hypothetical protein n=1 Tax=Parabacteroides leei TaxID=2939491 RepID=UPI0020175984|nr:hypothetical protein [Parabacteroides leei]MCL3851509.1 hypothetical protein [Parabacteroides leei]